MRILALVTDAYGGQGGIAQFNRDLFDALATLDCVEKIIILPRVGSGRLHPAEKTTQLKAPASKGTYAAAALLQAAAGRFDLIWCGHLNLAPLAFVLSKLLKVPYWIQIHGIEAWQRPRKLVRFCAEKAAKVLAVSRFTRRKFLSWADYDPANAGILPNTVDAGEFSPGPESEALVSEFRLQGKKVLLTTGRLSSLEKYKGHDRILRILPALLKKDADWVYVIAGEGDDRQRLERLAAEMGVESVVRFTGALNKEKLLGLYRTADVFAMPSTGEGFGIVFLEALACGLPVVAGEADGSRDPLGDGIAGQLVPAEDPEALETAILAALKFQKGTCDPGRFSKQHFRTHVEKILRQAA